MDEIIKKQILIVRDTGKTNMFDVKAVQLIADELGLFELVYFLEEKQNQNLYVTFILYGK